MPYEASPVVFSQPSLVMRTPLPPPPASALFSKTRSRRPCCDRKTVGVVLINGFAADARYRNRLARLANRCATTLQRDQQLRIVSLRVARPVTLDAGAQGTAGRSGRRGLGSSAL